MNEFNNNYNNGEQNTESNEQNNSYRPNFTQPINNQQGYVNQPSYSQQQYSQPNYGQPNYSQPQYQYRPEQNRYQQGGYGYNFNNDNYQQKNARVSDNKENKTSKGFVVGMVALGVVLSVILCSIVSIFVIPKFIKTDSNNNSGNDEIIIKHEGETNTATTNKGIYANAAAIALDTVVEINTETVTHNSIVGQYVTQGAGSGVIISSTDDGTYIITCAHVIEGATTVNVILTDGSEYTATYSAYDTITDIGVLKINVSGLKSATVGKFSDVVVGQEVLAIGNPLGELGGSVTNGIVSALEREILIDGLKYNLLQTNAAINPGNSGGGLFDLNGNLIGIVNAKTSGTGIEGLGFSIPIDHAMEVFEELVKNGYVSGRVQIGVTLTEITSSNYYNYWQYRKYISAYGVYIMETTSDKLKVWDRIVSIGNQEVSTIAEIRQILLDYKVGDTVEIQVSRVGVSGRAELVTVEIVLSEKTSG